VIASAEDRAPDGVGLGPALAAARSRLASSPCSSPSPVSAGGRRSTGCGRWTTGPGPPLERLAGSSVRGS
jgi:hypothetical protein